MNFEFLRTKKLRGIRLEQGSIETSRVIWSQKCNFRV